MSYIGVDLGTSSVKLLLLEKDGAVLGTVTREYPVQYPRPGWSQQRPEDWLEQTVDGLRELLAGHDAAGVQGLGVGGQMHGLVLLDKDDHVIRPAILWNDGRTEKQVDYLNETVGRQRLSRCTANIAFAGFTAPKVLWVKENEPEHYARIAKIMLPKDYLVYVLTGVHATDVSDASGMLLLDVKNRCWSREMCEICGVDPAWLPRVFESYEAVGRLKPDYQTLLSLPAVLVAAGAGDNAAAAVGTGTVGDGHCNISLGTSGTIFISSRKFSADPGNALHSFAHADGGYHLMGCMLSAASCNQWWQNKIIGTADYRGEEAKITPEKLGRNHVYFLPYLMGERSPLNDTNARALFAGMTMDTTRADMTQAMLEGVAFAIRDSFEVAKGLGLAIARSNICGGGSKSALWKTIVANVLGIPLDIVAGEQGAGYGAAMLAMVACGEYATVQQAVEAIVRVKETIFPDPALAAAYQKRYEVFRLLYPSLKDAFRVMAREQG